jgi:hypothetical protein
VILVQQPLTRAGRRAGLAAPSSWMSRFRLTRARPTADRWLFDGSSGAFQRAPRLSSACWQSGLGWLGSLGELLGDEVGAEQYQRDSGGLFRSLAPAFADLGADGQPELCRYEGLEGDGHDDGGDGQMSQADRESDGQLVQADAEPQCSER